MTTKKSTTILPSDKIDSMVGLFFHSVDSEGKVNWQGQILYSLNDEYFIVSTYDWIVGSDNGVRRMTHISDMKNWYFYSSAESMNFNYEHHLGRSLQQEK